MLIYREIFPRGRSGIDDIRQHPVESGFLDLYNHYINQYVIDEILNFSGSTNCSNYPTGYLIVPESALPDKQGFLILGQDHPGIKFNETFFSFSKIQGKL